MPDIYSRIEQLCRRHRINITVMCKRCNIPRASLSDYKMGRIKTLSAATLSKISEYFGVSVEYLMAGEAPPVDEQTLRTSLFGKDITVTDEMWEEVMHYVQYIKERESAKNNI